MRVLVLNGPNLNLLGTREPDVYGDTTLEDLEGLIEGWGAALGIETLFSQSNHEGELVDAIHRADGVDGLIINPGALTHTSRSIGDAISSVGLPAIEVHISNVRQREPWRAISLVGPSCVRTIFGRGIGGYQDALRHLQNRAATPFETVGYGPHPDNVGDIRRPDGEVAGLVVLIHGGLWRQEYERDSTETLAVDLTDRGYITWNIEYRRGRQGHWPAPAHDVVSAIDFIAREMPGIPTGIVGHSAGGHLGLWAAGRRADDIRLFVGLAPITDLAAMAGAGCCRIPGRPKLARLRGATRCSPDRRKDAPRARREGRDRPRVTFHPSVHRVPHRSRHGNGSFPHARPQERALATRSGRVGESSRLSRFRVAAVIHRSVGSGPGCGRPAHRAGPRSTAESTSYAFETPLVYCWMGGSRTAGGGRFCGVWYFGQYSGRTRIRRDRTRSWPHHRRSSRLQLRRPRRTEHGLLTAMPPPRPRSRPSRQRPPMSSPQRQSPRTSPGGCPRSRFAPLSPSTSPPRT